MSTVTAASTLNVSTAVAVGNLQYPICSSTLRTTSLLGIRAAVLEATALVLYFKLVSYKESAVLGLDAVLILLLLLQARVYCSNVLVTCV